jgi:hypothetical protein
VLPDFTDETDNLGPGKGLDIRLGLSTISSEGEGGRAYIRNAEQVSIEAVHFEKTGDGQRKAGELEDVDNCHG